MLKLQVGIIAFGAMLVLLSCFIGEYDATRRSSRRRRRSYTRCRNICEPGSCVSKHTTIGCGGSGGGGSVVVVPKPTPAPISGPEETNCDWADNSAGRGSNRVFVPGRYTPSGCAAACREKRKTNAKINGATFRELGNGCFCEEGMYLKASFPKWKACYLAETKPIEPADKGCDWKTGNGVGLKGKIFVGTGYTHAMCAAACKSKSKSNTAINGASYNKNSRVCYCDAGMFKRITFLKFYDSCYLTETAHHSCKFTEGEGLPKRSWKNLGKITGSACVEACEEERKKDPSINGVTIRANVYRPQCFCYFNMTGISTSTKSTMFYKACFLEPEPTAAPEEAVTTAAPEEAMTTAAPEEAATTAEPEEPESTAAPEEAATTAAPEKDTTEPLEWDVPQQLKAIEDEIENEGW